MTGFSEFFQIVQRHPEGVVLLEGRRTIPLEDYQAASRLAQHLAAKFPQLRFRSGNAKGADQAFVEGVAKIDETRLQIVAPYPTHRRSVRLQGARYESPANLTKAQTEAVALLTIRGTPQNRGLIEKRNLKGSVAAKGTYLMRDTMKVTGHSDAFPAPVYALFYVDPQDPMTGGTGHTVRVCQLEGIPMAFQDSWKLWLE